jgi:hypothetical protein
MSFEVMRGLSEKPRHLSREISSTNRAERWKLYASSKPERDALIKARLGFMARVRVDEIT